jgi:thiol-disulfide isomerase/thioredoxin
MRHSPLNTHHSTLLCTLLFLISVVETAVALPFPLSLFTQDGAVSARTYVLMINGGGRREHNYQSHLLHVQALLRVLLQAGIRRDHVSIFSSDGDDPTPDLAVSETQDSEFWLLQGTSLEGPLGPPITYANSVVPGVRLQPATRAGLQAWFEAARRRLRRGDTLLVYVTDHGSKNAVDIANNRITLWGKDESLSVRELKELLGKLNPGVRVVALMSQCYSGAFANLSYDRTAEALPDGNVCGYFSSTADRPAYGCYPENRGKDNVGHSFHFIRALESSAAFPAAHEAVLVTDRTPDVPLRTSDLYLEDLLRRRALRTGQELSAVVDALLSEAWRDKATWEPEIRLLDRIAHAVGYFSPRSLAELDAQSTLLPDVSDKLKTYANSWGSALASLAQQNLQRFLRTQAEWPPRLFPVQLQQVDPSALRSLTESLLADLAAFTRADAVTDARLRVLKEKADAAAAASYRMHVRLGVVLRLRAVLTSIAGRLYVSKYASGAERQAFEGLLRCEDFRLGDRHAANVQLATADPFPSYDEEVKLAEDASPAWMGIRYKQASPNDRTRMHLGDGAAAVVAVYPDSPAKRAGLAVGDFVLGPPGAPFTEPNQIREWTMLSAVHERAPLMVLRGRRRLQVALVPEPFPLVWPDLPAPPKVGAVAPRLQLETYRGTAPRTLADGKAHLLFFWATWCAPCKASLPEVLAFEHQRHVQVIALTDESRAQLDTFFAHYGAGFPETVAMDEYRRAFLAYGVSGTPTFVLVDGDGSVRSYTSGYTPDKGIGVAGWSWGERTPAATSP